MLVSDVCSSVAGLHSSVGGGAGGELSVVCVAEIACLGSRLTAYTGVHGGAAALHSLLPGRGWQWGKVLQSIK
jgi:hypothetical protein